MAYMDYEQHLLDEVARAMGQLEMKRLTDPQIDQLIAEFRAEEESR